MLQNNNNKEQFRLLDLSSDSESEELHLEIAPASRKKKMHRKARPRLHHQTNLELSTSSHTSNGVAVKVGLVVCFGAGIFWLLTLTWLTTALHDHIMRIDVTLQTGLYLIFLGCMHYGSNLGVLFLAFHLLIFLLGMHCNILGLIQVDFASVENVVPTPSRLGSLMS